jgi:decaprenyl-phosphate phosphoribosyltransferase
MHPDAGEDTRPSPWSWPIYVVRLLRVHQWAKNGFVMAPVVFSGKFVNLGIVGIAVQATLVFSLMSSLIYVVNDILDLRYDRAHPVKRRRPLAAGLLSVRTACAAAVVLLVIATPLTYPLPVSFTLTVAGYVVLNVLYSLWLKHVVILDVFSIAMGFVLRVVGGSVAISTSASPWILLCTMGLALFLAAAKRRQEVLLVSVNGKSRRALSEYAKDFLEKLMLISVNLVVVSYSLFALTVRPNLAWGIPLVLFGVFRYYYLVEIRGMGEAPAEALFQDKPLLACVTVWVILNVGLVGWV